MYAATSLSSQPQAECSAHGAPDDCRYGVRSSGPWSGVQILLHGAVSGLALLAVAAGNASMRMPAQRPLCQGLADLPPDWTDWGIHTHTTGSQFNPNVSHDLGTRVNATDSCFYAQTDINANTDIHEVIFYGPADIGSSNHLTHSVFQQAIKTTAQVVFKHVTVCGETDAGSSVQAHAVYVGGDFQPGIGSTFIDPLGRLLWFNDSVSSGTRFDFAALDPCLLSLYAEVSAQRIDFPETVHFDTGVATKIQGPMLRGNYVPGCDAFHEAQAWAPASAPMLAWAPQGSEPAAEPTDPAEPWHG